MDQPIRRPPWFMITALVIGIVLGLLSAWYWFPVERIDTHPATMRSDFKDSYRVAIASAFEANGDLGRAQARLSLLQDENPQEVLSSQAQVMMASGGSQNEARALGLLAAALSEVVAPGDGGPETGPGDPTDGGNSDPGSSTLSPTITPISTQTPIPTLTPTATAGAPFTVELFTEVCDPDLPGPLIQVFVLDATRQPVPGVEVVVRWDGEEDRFFTGLKIEVGPGYADFSMEPGVEYSLSLVLGDQPVTGLATHECDIVDGSPVFSSWEIIFVQP
ncbi:MAG: hypothetical protein OEV06_07090 [Anaerolineae bacterium]|nr:hypothetical protein [Anaerolineae bacterium]